MRILTTIDRFHSNVLLVASSCLLLAEAVRGQAVSDTNRVSSDRGSVKAPDVVQFSTGGPADMLATKPFAMPSMTLNRRDAVSANPLAQPLAELKQKLQALLEAGDYETALWYANAGLDVRPKDLQFLTAKAIALTKLHRLPAAITAYKDVLIVEPDNVELVNSLAELLLITGRIDEYQKFLAQHKTQIDAAYDGLLVKYFSVLEAYQTKATQQFREAVTQTITALPSVIGSYLPGWDFEEGRSMVAQKSDSPKNAMLTAFIQVLTAGVSREDGLKKIKGQ
jgi:hypothetical protein